ncbi:MAG TPA: hypothetical protein VNB22_21670 [Pyrinomonadaceae bacterium]|nr:hypothetical protein [Pyrinomonadaceae bacterium]
MSLKTDILLNQANLDENHSSFSSAEKTFPGEAQAVQIFSVLKAKLFSINEWNAHSMLSTFKLFDENGQPLQTEKLLVGVFLQIALKGTVKYDWVRVIDIYEAADEFIITVKPTFDPTAEEIDKSVVSHFFTDESTNNFCLLRRVDTVALYVIGLNEKMNTAEAKNTLEAARNAAVNLGSYLGIQRGEWEKFCHHLLEDAVKSQTT